MRLSLEEVTNHYETLAGMDDGSRIGSLKSVLPVQNDWGHPREQSLGSEYMLKSVL